MARRRRVEQIFQVIKDDSPIEDEESYLPQFISDPIKDENSDSDISSPAKTLQSIPSSQEAGIKSEDNDLPKKRSVDTVARDNFFNFKQIKHDKPNVHESALFEQFTRRRGPAPRKEYIKIKIARGLKKALRELKQAKIPRRALHRFESHDIHASKKWGILKAFYSQYKDILDKVSDVTHEGDEGYKSLNDCYMKRLFCRPEVRIAYRIYLSLTFSNMDSEDLCQRFNMK